MPTNHNDLELPVPHSPSSTVPPESPIHWNGFSLQGPPFGLEKIMDYEPGGHHPVHLGDQLGNDRYRVIHKLGAGGFGNVWLCRDLESSETTKYVALKILMADVSTKDSPELQMNQKLHNIFTSSENEPATRHICLPSLQFNIDGPNGSHHCFVYPVLGPRVTSFILSQFDEPDKCLKRLCQQTVQALKLLHANDICHGDFTPSNILLAPSSFDGFDEQSLLAFLGEPEKTSVVTQSGKPPSDGTAPEYLVHPINWDIDMPKFISDQTYIGVIDFGESYTVSNPPEHLGIPSSYKSPELILDKTTGKSCDIWALGCTIFEIRTGRKLFAPFDDDDDSYLEEITQVLGKLPEPWWSTTWKSRRDWYKDEADEHGRVVDVEKLDHKQREKVPGVISTFHPSVAQGARSLRDKLKPGVWYIEAPGKMIHREISQEEMNVFGDLLSQLLRFEPNKRVSAELALEHVWFRD